MYRDTYFYTTNKAKYGKESYVSIPYTSGHPFLQTPEGEGQWAVLICVNPLYIRTPISTWRLTMSISGQLPMSVNPLYIGTPISTALELIVILMIKDVSIPYTSGHPFLRRLGFNRHHIFFVSIPYTSGHPFLQERPSNQGLKKVLCQSPIHRATHFYNSVSNMNYLWTQLCQSPIHRDTHFYGKRYHPDDLCVDSVSIPYTSGHPFLLILLKFQ